MSGSTRAFLTYWAEITTTAVTRKGGGVKFKTEVCYLPFNRNVKGEAGTEPRPGGSMTLVLDEGDDRSRIRLWNGLFEMVAGVRQNRPGGIRWRVDLNNVANYWRGVLDLAIEVTAMELDVEVTYEGRWNCNGDAADAVRWGGSRGGAGAAEFARAGAAEG